MPPQVLDPLGTHDFPDNVRELRAIVHDAASRQASPMLALADFKADIQRKTPLEPGESAPSLRIFSRGLPTLDQAQELLIDEELKRANGNHSLAAVMPGISHQALNKRIRQRALKAGSVSQE